MKTYADAMKAPDKDKWQAAIDEEHKRMMKHKVWRAVPRSKATGKRIITNTWAMKKKSNGTYRARMAARGFEQVDGLHVDHNTKSAPVISHATVMIMLILITMRGWYAHMLDVNGAFLLGTFDRGEEIYMEVPEGMKHHYNDNTVLLLLKTLYGLIQAALCFWRYLLQVLGKLQYEKSKADPCLYFRWQEGELSLWASWVDDLICCGDKKAVLKTVAEMKNKLPCDDAGELKEYVGCAVEYDKAIGRMTLRQPVLLQSLRDEFPLPGGSAPSTPAEPGKVLDKDEEGQQLDADGQHEYRKGVGKLLHLTRWTKPQINNAVRELTRFGGSATKKHLKAMYRSMLYCMKTARTGRVLQPNTRWDGSRDFEFVISGMSDSDYAKDPLTRRSVSGYCTYLCGALVTSKSKMQGCVTLSVTEAESVAAVSCAQDMLFIKNVLESLSLKVRLPMVLWCDNQGAVDLFNNWNVTGRTRHMAVRYNFIRELKGILEVRWTATATNTADIFTKNLGEDDFTRHAKALNSGIGEDCPGESVTE